MDIYTEKTIEELGKTEEINNNVKQLELIENKIKNMTKKNECLTCCNENIQSIIYKCCHVVNKLQKPYKCLVCRKESIKIKKCYVI
jgi:hypothetical protein